MPVTDTPRIEELRRRVQKDPTSIAFAQLAEEYRRVGNYEEAVNVCRSGLARHPSYLSARVTLGRALMELQQFDEAQAELDMVLDLAPDNLAAIRALAEIHQRRVEAGDTLHKPPPPGRARADTPPARRVEHDEALADLPPLPKASAAGLEQSPIAPPEQPAAAAPQPLSALDALGALTLDLPPAPDFSSWTLDTNFSLPDDEATSAPHAGSPSLEPASAWTLDTSFSLPDASESAPQDSGASLEPASSWTLDTNFSLPAELAPAPQATSMSLESPESDPVVEELERWLAAIVADRSQQR